MTGEQLATLVNVGVGGAVIAVVIVFLRFIKERDAEWRSFFTSIRESDSKINGQLADVIDKLTARVEGLDKNIDTLRGEFSRHDATEMEFLRGVAVRAAQDRKTQPRKGGAKSFGEP